MISPDTRSTALEALEILLQDYRDSISSQPEHYAKYDLRTGELDWRGEIHRRRMASRIRSVRSAIRELDALPRQVAA